MKMNNTNESKRIIFLDIDGVLQPGWNQKRFDHDLEQTRIEMAEKFNDDTYLSLDMYDIGAVLYDWDEDALKNLRILLAYRDVTHYVVLDDEDFNKYFPEHIVQTSHTFKAEDLAKAMKILGLV